MRLPVGAGNFTVDGRQGHQEGSYQVLWVQFNPRCPVSFLYDIGDSCHHEHQIFTLSEPLLTLQLE